MTRLGRRAFLSVVAFVGPLVRMLGAQAFSLDDFLRLSSRLTGYMNLDRAAADTFLKALASSPDAAKLTHPDPTWGARSSPRGTPACMTFAANRTSPRTPAR